MGYIESNRLGAIKPIKIKVLNIETNEVQAFCSMGEAASVFNVPSSHIFNLLSSIDKTRLFKKKYIIVRDGQDSPTITQEEYETLLRPHGKSFIAYNVTKKMYHIYESAAEFIRDNVLSKKSITTNLKRT